MVPVDKNHCSGCGACNNICPTRAIEMIYDKEGFLYPEIDPEKCCKCNQCDSVCPYINGKTYIALDKNYPKTYACYSKNNTDRRISSSGAIFPLVAKNVLSQGGVVYGAAFNNDFTVRHLRITDEKDLIYLQGSKYLQSEIFDVFQNILADLNANMLVLFSGTSCQIAGLLSYLRVDYDKLITVDLICKSIPSPIIWKQYLAEFYKKQIIQSVNFKDKRRGWDKFVLAIQTDKKEYIIKGMQSLYMQGFFKGIYCRPACFECPFKTTERLSDITLADCWGVEFMAKELFDNKGTSSVIINSIKGQLIFEEIQNDIVSISTKIEDVAFHNPYYLQKAHRSKNRKVFYFLKKKIPFKLLMCIFCYPYVQNAKIIIKKILKRGK